jgi:hypothetical protein
LLVVVSAALACSEILSSSSPVVCFHFSWSPLAGSSNLIMSGVVFTSRRRAIRAGAKAFKPSSLALRSRGSSMARSLARKNAISVLRSRGVDVSFGVERKFLDTIFASNALTTAPAFQEDGTLLCLNATAIGDTESTRNGRQQTNKGIFIHGTVDIAAAEGQTAPLGTNYARILLVRDIQPNGAQGTATNVLKTSSYGFRNLQFVERYQVLRDFIVKMPVPPITQAAANDFSWGAQSYPFRINVPLKDVTTYTGTTAVIASVATNAYHLIACCQSTQGAPSIQYTSRFRWIG